PHLKVPVSFFLDERINKYDEIIYIYIYMYLIYMYLNCFSTEYYSEEGKTFKLHIVGKIKQQLNADPTLCQGYPSSFGLTDFTRRATEVALGKSSQAIMENRVLGVQTTGFTAAVRLGAELLRHWYNVGAAWCGPVYLSAPCDDSLTGIFQAAGIEDIRKYCYWDDKRRAVCLEKLLEDLRGAPERSVVVLSASSHYPTGADLSRNQWAMISQLIMVANVYIYVPKQKAK
uniref:aspartate transaminase n=1 Tax=Echeneis naucrates TaxID=173247 RepID=A0A665W177_ECHNA